MKPAVFLDRDGTLNEEVGYLHRPEDVVLIPGSAEAIARLNARGVPVIVVTNQAGIGQGKYGWEDFHAVMDHIAEVRQLFIDTLENWPVGEVPKSALYGKKAPAKRAAKKAATKKKPAARKKATARKKTASRSKAATRAPSAEAADG